MTGRTAGGPRADGIAPLPDPWQDLWRICCNGADMGTLVLVRHGQASFLAEDYDRLSARGEAQARALAAQWLREGRHFDRVCTGTLRRQADTEAIVRDAYGKAAQPWPDATRLDGLDEFPAEPLVRMLVPRLLRTDARVRALHASYRNGATDDDRRGAAFQILERVTAHWIAGDCATTPLPSWEEFRQGVSATLTPLLAAAAAGDEVAVFTSGGVIGVCALDHGDEADAGALIWRLLNCSLTELSCGPGGTTLARYNVVTHLPTELHTQR